MSDDIAYGDGWRPIESAPRGRHLFYFPAEKRLPEMIKVDLYPLAQYRQPTHWQPLPAPPSLIDKEDRNG